MTRHFYRLSVRTAFILVAGWLLMLKCAGAFAIEPLRIVAIGDSLIAGYGLKQENGFTFQLEKSLKQQGCIVEIVNSGVSGDTTSGGLSRIDWVLSDPYSGVILLLGYNDALRAIPVELVHQNLFETIEKIQSRTLPLLLAGAMAPRNLGADYYERFDSIYLELAETFDLVFYPFFLDGVATEPLLNQDDGIHPNEAGVALIVGQMLPYVEQLISQILASETSDFKEMHSGCSV